LPLVKIQDRGYNSIRRKFNLRPEAKMNTIVTVVINNKTITITSIAELNELLQRTHISTAGNLIAKEA
jgi:hypothetical protein